MMLWYTKWKMEIVLGFGLFEGRNLVSHFFCVDQPHYAKYTVANYSLFPSATVSYFPSNLSTRNFEGRVVSVRDRHRVILK
mmetsp:Transcript_396/g.467  ORF Transcript_396/g.467 Transcript_396/m.467 type:complete len:81 (+) Transcript_396:246-488(+)